MKKMICTFPCYSIPQVCTSNVGIPNGSIETQSRPAIDNRNSSSSLVGILSGRLQALRNVWCRVTWHLSVSNHTFRRLPTVIRMLGLKAQQTSNRVPPTPSQTATSMAYASYLHRAARWHSFSDSLRSQSDTAQPLTNGSYSYGATQPKVSQATHLTEMTRLSFFLSRWSVLKKGAVSLIYMYIYVYIFFVLHKDKEKSNKI